MSVHGRIKVGETIFWEDRLILGQVARALLPWEGVLELVPCSLQNKIQ